MNIPQLGTLTQVDVRQAWTHEAYSFTPWLAENLDALASVIGVPLEIEGREVAVQGFYADILARNPLDDSLVLIENQLEGTDHGHLGQIMTYLAGLNARIVVWVASRFRDEHLSALKWLNENTPETFAFFAVEVKAVRIGDSPIAPVFELVARPNHWERKLEAIARETQEMSGHGKARREFWEAYVARFPDEAAWGPPSAVSNRWHNLDDLGLVISKYIAVHGVGIFIRGPRGTPNNYVEQVLAPYGDRLATALDYDLSEPGAGYHFHVVKPGEREDRSAWPDMMDWLHETTAKYERALRQVLESQD